MRAISRDYQTNIKRTHDTAELFLLGGNLNNGTNAGRRYANLNNGLTNANWNYAARNSEKWCVMFRSSGRNLERAWAVARN